MTNVVKLTGVVGVCVDISHLTTALRGASSSRTSVFCLSVWKNKRRRQMKLREALFPDFKSKINRWNVANSERRGISLLTRGIPSS
jgi:hypothetical protein